MSTRSRSRTITAATTAAVVALFFGGAAEVQAVATATPNGIKLTNPDATPVASAEITLTFNGQTYTGKSDKDGLVPILFRDRRADDPQGAIILSGDGTGVIKYRGGPGEGESFTVTRGVITMGTSAAAPSLQHPAGLHVGAPGVITNVTSAAAPSEEVEGGLGKTAYIAAAILAVGGGAVALTSGSDSAANNNTTSTPDFSAFSASLSANMTVNGCGQQASVALPLTTTVGSDSACSDPAQTPPCKQHTLNKGGLMVPGTIDFTGRGVWIYRGPINGLHFVPNGAIIEWIWRAIMPSIPPRGFNGTGRVTVNSPPNAPCPQLDTMLVAN